MGNWGEVVQGRFQKENVAFQSPGARGYIGDVWSRSMRIERKREIRENAEKIYKMVPEPSLLYTGLYYVQKKTDVDRIKLVAGCKAISFEEKAIKWRKEANIRMYKRKEESRV